MIKEKIICVVFIIFLNLISEFSVYKICLISLIVFFLIRGFSVVAAVIDLSPRSGTDPGRGEEKTIKSRR